MEQAEVVARPTKFSQMELKEDPLWISLSSPSYWLSLLKGCVIACSKCTTLNAKTPSHCWSLIEIRRFGDRRPGGCQPITTNRIRLLIPFALLPQHSTLEKVQNENRGRR